MDGHQNTVEIYTDGACIGNPGAGGWGAIILYSGQRKELSGSQQSTTSNRMEIMAAIEGLSFLKRPCNVIVYTDSQYLQKGISQWIKKWVKKNFAGIKNDDLWRKLLKVSDKHCILWQWVKAHNGNYWNEKVDKLAEQQARSLPCLPYLSGQEKIIVDDGTLPW